MYFVIETQVNSSGVGATIVTQAEDRANAESKYHTILAAAAISNLPQHGATILTGTGYPILNDGYEREVDESDESE